MGGEGDQGKMRGRKEDDKRFQIEKEKDTGMRMKVYSVEEIEEDVV